MSEVVSSAQSSAGQTASVPNTGSVKNENTAQVKQSVEVAGGDSFVSFDALEQAGVLSKTKAKSEPAKPSSKETKEESSKEEKTVKDVKSEEKVAQNKPVAKVYKVKAGDKEVSLASDGSIEIQSKDGKAQNVTVQDLINSFHGTSEIHRRLTALDQERKSFLAEQKVLQDTYKEISKRVSGDKMMSVVDYMVEAAGGDPVTMKEKLLQELTEDFESFSQLTPEERKFRSIERENEILKKKQSELSVKEQEAAVMREVQEKVNHVKKTYNLDDQKFFELYQELKEAGIPERDIEPETVAHFADEKRLFDHVSAEITAVNKEFPDAEELAYEVTQQLIAGNLDIEDIKATIRELAAPKEDLHLEEKIKATSSGRSPRTPKNAGSDPLTFDDLN